MRRWNYADSFATPSDEYVLKSDQSFESMDGIYHYENFYDLCEKDN